MTTPVLHFSIALIDIVVVACRSIADDGRSRNDDSAASVAAQLGADLALTTSLILAKYVAATGNDGSDTTKGSRNMSKRLQLF